jgi:hypothetical protein
MMVMMTMMTCSGNTRLAFVLHLDNSGNVYYAYTNILLFSANLTVPEMFLHFVSEIFECEGILNWD